MRIHLQFSENIGTLIGDGVHPPFPALACPLVIDTKQPQFNCFTIRRSSMRWTEPLTCDVSA